MYATVVEWVAATIPPLHDVDDSSSPAIPFVAIVVAIGLVVLIVRALQK